MEINQSIQTFSLLALPLLLALTLHELAHGWVAEKLGDGTARDAGRLTMNPLKHLDLMGTLVFVVTQLVGWAKPVPVDPRNFRNPKKDMAIVAAAGPLVNIIIAIVSAILFRLQEPVVELILNYQLNDLLNVVLPVFYMINISARINIALAIFNIIPIPPLDGGRMLAGVLSHEQVIKFSKIEPYGFIIIVVLLMSGIIGKAIFPIIMTITKLLLG
ncbi:MAG: site-2 protease family protein [Nitrospinota bacterium]|jgi:Zn-dependent protease|nr:site-2 protease family protein [Nitrospinota bacterium]MDP7350897.1 site-2 protease family protein [Nitrospinota bacterium]MDP7580331.1 site-2 protease family protein [Nitrospinota bacterium]HJN01712.1 site-2 protease family protein [Nitrospinota bacterium]